MPYKDKEKRTRVSRSSKRAETYGRDWRGIIEHFGRCCVNTARPELEDFCLVIDQLEIHHPLYEDSRALTIEVRGVKEDVILVCRYCHRGEHRSSPFPLQRGLDSMYLEDTDREVLECGSLEAWREKYQVGASFGLK